MKYLLLVTSMISAYNSQIIPSSTLKQGSSKVVQKITKINQAGESQENIVTDNQVSFKQDAGNLDVVVKYLNNKGLISFKEYDSSSQESQWEDRQKLGKLLQGKTGKIQVNGQDIGINQFVQTITDQNRQKQPYPIELMLETLQNDNLLQKQKTELFQNILPSKSRAQTVKQLSGNFMSDLNLDDQELDV